MIIKKKSQMVKVNLVIDHKNWKFKYPKVKFISYKKVLKKFYHLFFHLVKTNFEISILLTGSKNMKNLNKKFRKINKDTDVLSFPAEEKDFFDERS